MEFNMVSIGLHQAYNWTSHCYWSNELESITMLDVDITAGFVTTDSDVPSLLVMSLKMKK